MRIRSVHIDSFGRFRDFSLTDLPDGLTVITGDNESGKTTLMEFMRSTMFPSSKRSVYPMPSPSDKGSIVLDTESGERLVLVREQRKISELSGKGVPSGMFSVDPDTYGTVFAMGLSDLANAEAISSDRIRNRFLTIPGGERVPAVLKDLVSERTAIMNDDRITERNPVGAIRKSMTEMDTRMAELMEGRDAYDSLVRRAEALRQDVQRAVLIQGATEEERGRRNLLESQRENVRAIFDLETRRKELGHAASLTDETISRHAMLTESTSELRDRIERTGEARPLPPEEISRINAAGRDISSFLNERDRMADRIESLKDSIAEDEERLDEIGLSPSGASPESRAELLRTSRTKAPAVPALLLVLAAALFAVYYFMDMTAAAYAGMAVVVSGLVLLAFRRDGRATKEWLSEHGYAEVERSRMPSFLMKLEKVHAINERICRNRSELEEIQRRTDRIRDVAVSLLGPGFADIEDAADEIGRLTELHESEARKAEAVSEMLMTVSENEEEIAAIEGPYGGREMFIRAKADRDELAETVQRIETLRESVGSATGMSVDSAVSEMNSVRADGPDMKDEIARMNELTGELNAKIREMRSDERLNRLTSERNAKEEELKDKVREWGVLYLQEAIIDRSCNELYSKMQPSVIRTANRYLGLMTHSRYAIDADPRRDGIVIQGSDGHKTSRQWSSGLGDQVYLSVKMAVAKEMGVERLPMILDDILVRFDRRRTASACEAILEFAKDQQVFLFSCVPLEGMFPEGSFRHVSL